MRYIAVDKLCEEVLKLVDRNKSLYDYDTGYRDGNNAACHAVLHIINKLCVSDSKEIKEEDEIRKGRRARKTVQV